MREIEVAEILQHLPKDRLPETWGAFLSAAEAQPEPWFAIRYEDPGALHHLPLRDRARVDLVPFLALGDGGYLAFWLRDSGTTVVFLGSDGEREVVAPGFDVFLGRLSARCTGLPHLDELPPPDEVPEPPPPFTVEGIAPADAAAPDEKASADEEFSAWFGSLAIHPPTFDAAAEQALRAAAFAAADRGIAAGEHPDYDADSPWWEVEVRFQRVGSTWRASLPPSGRALDEGHPLARLGAYLDAVCGPDVGDTVELCISLAGTVTIGKHKEIVPPA